MPEILTAYRVFLATPGGQPEIRQAFRNIVDEISQLHAVHNGVIFIPQGWEDARAGHRRAQTEINSQLLENADFFILALRNYWGTPTGADETSYGYSSGSHEEYVRAEELLKDKAAPMTDLAVFFADLPPESLRRPGKHLKPIIEFRKRLDRERQPYYELYESLPDFERTLRGVLLRWLRNHHEQEASQAEEHSSDKRRTDTKQEPDQPLSLLLRNSSAVVAAASRLVEKGNVTEAEQLLATSWDQGDPHAAGALGELLLRQQRPAYADMILAQARQLAESSGALDAQAFVLHTLGAIALKQSEFERAEELLDHALVLFGELGFEAGVASTLNHLGCTHLGLGDLDRAENELKRAEEGANRLNDLVGQLAAHSNLGLVYATRGDFDRAEVEIRRAAEKAEQVQDVATYTAALKNLGIVFQQRGEYLRAERVLLQALQSAEQSGDTVGIASVLGTLGALYLNQGDFPRAEKTIRNSLDVYGSNGDTYGFAISYNNLGVLYQRTDQPDRAREMYTLALHFSTRFGGAQVSKIENSLQEL